LKHVEDAILLSYQLAIHLINRMVLKKEVKRLIKNNLETHLKHLLKKLFYINI